MHSMLERIELLEPGGGRELQWGSGAVLGEACEGIWGEREAVTALGM